MKKKEQQKIQGPQAEGARGQKALNEKVESYEPPKLMKFEKLEKLIVSGE